MTSSNKNKEIQIAFHCRNLVAQKTFMENGDGDAAHASARLW
jgi:hypothetical protein